MVRALLAPIADSRRALLAAVLMSVAGLTGLTRPAGALELVEEPLPVAGERTIAEETPAADENVGEPAAEDAPVEGEPGVGEAPVVPPDEDPPAADNGQPSPSDAPAGETEKK